MLPHRLCKVRPAGPSSLSRLSKSLELARRDADPLGGGADAEHSIYSGLYDLELIRLARDAGRRKATEVRRFPYNPGFDGDDLKDADV